MDYTWFKKAYRDISHNKLKTIPLILMLIIGTSFSLAFVTGISSMNQNFNIAWNQNHYHTSLITLQPMSEQQIESYISQTIQQTHITPSYEIRYSFDASVYSPETNTSFNALIYAVNGTRSLSVDNLIYEQGPTLYQSSTPHAAVMDKINALNSGIGGSSVLNVSSQFGQFNLNVINKVYSPEYLWEASYKTEFLPIYTGPIIWMKLSDLSSFINTSNVINQLSLYFSNPGKDQQQFLSEFVNIAGSSNVLSMQGRDQLLTNFSLFYGSFALLIGIIFYGSAMVMTIIIISRFIDEEFPVLGLFKSLGMKNRELLTSPMIFSIIIGMIGSFIGVVGGLLLAIPIYSVLTGFVRSVPGNHLIIDPTAILIYLSVPIIITIIATLFASRKILSINPQEAMRPSNSLQVPSKSRLTTLYINIRKSKFSPFRIYSIRYLTQNKSKVLGLFFGIVLATTIISFSFSFLVAYDNTASNKYQYDNWDMNIEFNSFVNQSDIPSVLQLQNSQTSITYEPEITIPIHISSDLANTFSISGFVPTSQMQLFEGHNVVSNNSLLISKGTALNYNLHIGSQLSIIATNDVVWNLTINGILTTGSINQMFTSIDTARLLAGYNKTKVENGLLIKTHNVSELKQHLENNPSIQKVTSLKQLKKQLNDTNTIFTKIFYMIIFIGIVIGVIITVTIITVTIGERKHDFINFRSLGIRNKEIFMTVFLEIFYTSLIAIFVGVAVGNISMAFSTDYLATLGFGMKFSLDSFALLGSIASVVFVEFLSVYLSLRSLFKTNIAEATLARMLG